MARKAKRSKKLNLPPLLVVGSSGTRARNLVSTLKRLGFDAEVLRPADKSFREKIAANWSAILIMSELSRLVPRIRETRALRQIPILLVYQNHRRGREAAALAQADDYLRLSSPARELLTRIQAVIERAAHRIDAFALKESYKALEQILATARSNKTDFEVLQFAAAQLAKIYPSSRSSIIIIDQARDRAVVIAETKTQTELNVPLKLKNYPEIRKVIETKKPLVITDVQRHPMMREVREILATKSIHSLLLVPVFYQEELIGVIVMRAVEPMRQYFPVDIYFARLVANSLAMALKNVRLARLAEEESKVKEKAIHQAKYSGAVSKRLEKLFQYASDGLVIVNDQGVATGVNLNFLRLTGFERRELVGKSIDELFEFEKPHPEAMREWLTKKRRSGSSNLLLKVKGGSKRFVAVHIELLPGAGREILISVHDVTEERKLSLELRQTKEFLENLIQNSMEAIIAADTTGKIIIFNRAAEELTGYKAKDMIGIKNIVDLYAPGAARAVMKKLRSPFYGGPGRLETTHNILIGKNGEEIPINMSAAIIYDDRGSEIATMGLYQDIRERVEIEKRLRQAQERLLESRRRDAVMALAGAAAHELNQPLTSILGYAEILKRAEDQLKQKLKADDQFLATAKNAVKVISEQATRMAEVIKKLGDITEVETREYAGNQKILDLDRGGRVEKNLTHALSLVGEAVILMDPELVILEAFGQAEQIFGEKPDRKSLSRYLEGVNYAAGMKLVEEAKTKNSAIEELDLRSAKGQIKRVLVRAEKTEAKEMLVVFFDVAELRQMQNQLKELVAFRGQLFQTMPVPLIVLDEDGRITHLSREAERLFGYDIEELKGKPPSMLIDNFDPAEFVLYLRKLRHEGILDGTFSAIDRAGRKFETYYSWGVMRDSAGGVVGYLAFLVDLSEKSFLEQALREKTAYLEAIQKNTAILIQSADWQEALASMLKELGRLFEFDVAAVVPTELAERGFFVLVYYPATGEKLFQEQRAFEQVEQVVRWLSMPETRYYEDVSKIDFSSAPGDAQTAIQEMLSRGYVNFIALPLKFQDEVVGRLFFGHHQPGYMKLEKLRTVHQLIEQITIAVSHFRLYFRLEKQRQRLVQRNLFLEQILEQSQKIDLDQDESQIFLQFLNLFQNIFPRAHLWLAWADPGRDFIIKSVSNLDPSLLGAPLAISSEIKEQLRLSGKPVHFEPGKEFAGFLESGQDLILVPIISESNLLGLLGVESHHREPYLAEEEFLLLLFSKYLALLIPNLLGIRQSVLFRSFQESLIQSTNAFILMINDQNEIVIFNRAFEEKLGVTKTGLKDLSGDGFFRRYVVMIQEEMGKTLSAGEVLSQIRTGKKFSSLRARFRSGSGDLFEAIFNIAGLRDDAGNLLGVIFVGQDLSPIREVEAKLLHFERLAGLGQMAAGVIHELSNPLQAVITYSELVKRRLDEIGETDASRRLTTVIEAGERARRLSQNLMSYARPGAEVFEEINLKSLVDEVLSFSSYELGRGRVELENLMPDNLPRLRAVKDQIEQVLINLLANASHACAEKGGGKIKIMASARDQLLELKIEDTGIGIKPEQLPRIFEPFFTTKLGGQGTGLGLNIVQSIVERHRGQIRIQSEPGQGTTFTIIFPVGSQ